MGYGCGCDCLVREMTRKKDKSHITDIFTITKTGNLTDFERRIPTRIEDLRSILDGRLTTGIDEFLLKADTEVSIAPYGSN